MGNRFVNKNNKKVIKKDYELLESLDIKRNKPEQEIGVNTITGYLLCELETKEPIIIPDAEKMVETDIEGHFKYPCFRYDDKVTIPGSSIRGAIRSVYEILTNSCLVTFKSIKADKTKQSCEDKDNCCSACVLFGMANKTNRSSKIRFTDAKPINGNGITNGYVTLDKLMSPKKYDEYFKTSKKKKNPPKLGTKFYRRKDLVNREFDKNNLNATFEVISKDQKFEFKVFFDGITEKQLKELKWALTLGNKALHTIGHAKPLGYGKVKTIIKQEVLRRIEEKYIDTNYEIIIDDVRFENNEAKKKIIELRSLL